ncbi:hypothetical protein HALDL1_09540 [Halobacterium sp. DL1]|jgi:hypothetical protein|nr:hypothetical protein HALDL1_09540 [Halobacterium sp. DL1]
MNARKALTGLALASILVAAVGVVASLAAALGLLSNAATLAFLVVAVILVVGAGVLGTGGPKHTRTPYWR